MKIEDAVPIIKGMPSDQAIQEIKAKVMGVPVSSVTDEEIILVCRSIGYERKLIKQVLEELREITDDTKPPSAVHRIYAIRRAIDTKLTNLRDENNV